MASHCASTIFYEGNNMLNAAINTSSGINGLFCFVFLINAYGVTKQEDVLNNIFVSFFFFFKLFVTKPSDNTPI